MLGGNRDGKERTQGLQCGAEGTVQGTFPGKRIHYQLCEVCGLEGKASNWGRMVEQWLSTRDDFAFKGMHGNGWKLFRLPRQGGLDIEGITECYLVYRTVLHNTDDMI